MYVSRFTLHVNWKKLHLTVPIHRTYQFSSKFSFLQMRWRKKINIVWQQFASNPHSDSSKDNKVHFYWLHHLVQFQGSTSQENLPTGFTTRLDSNWPAQVQERASFEVSCITTAGIILSRQRTTKALISLRKHPRRLIHPRSLTCSFVVHI